MIRLHFQLLTLPRKRNDLQFSDFINHIKIGPPITLLNIFHSNKRSINIILFQMSLAKINISFFMVLSKKDKQNALTKSVSHTLSTQKNAFPQSFKLGR